MALDRAGLLQAMEPFLTEFRRAIAAERAKGATEAEVESLVWQIEELNRDAMEPELLAFYMKQIRLAARRQHEATTTRQ
jgi:hypothetical protein